MLLTSKGRYAVMAMADIAVNNNNEPINLEAISKRQNIALSYLEQIFINLKKSGLVNSMKGPGGGYSLKLPADSIAIADILKAVEKPMKMTRCNNRPGEGCMQDNSRCITHNFWEDLSNHINLYLHSISLADLCKQVSCKRKQQNQEVTT